MTQASNFRIEEIDWSREWSQAYAGASIAMRRASNEGYWNKRAARFSAMDNGASGRVQALLDRIGVDSGTTILDIGCGPGNLAIPLAKQAGHVTAIDPAQGMLDILQNRAAENDLNNISCITGRWDDMAVGKDIEPHDIVLSSYSMIMKDVRAALQNMQAAAKDTVCIFWFASRECFGYDKVWPALFGEEYVAGPNHTYLLNILNNMGVYPNVAILPQKHVVTYESLDDAVDSWAENMFVSSAKEQGIIREYLEQVLFYENDVPTYSRNVLSAMLWWQPR